MTDIPRSRRFVALMSLAIAFAVAGLVGCGGGSETAQAAAEAVAENGELATTEASDESPVESDDPASDPAQNTDDDQAGPTFRALPQADGVPEGPPDTPLPIGLNIPSLSIDDSPIRPVGVEANGDFEVPIASEVGWYRFGSGPGQEGSTVMAAHIAYDGEDGVFRYLSTIEMDELVEVSLDDGSTVEYRIVDRVEYKKTALPFDDIFAESGPDRLVLITCGGEFNPALGSYESNVVAYAEPVS